MENKNKKGFTLVQLLVTIAIIGILSAITIVAIRGARTKAKIAHAKSEIRQVYDTFILLGEDTEEWPGHLTPNTVCDGASGNEIEDLSSEEAGLTQNDSSNPYGNWGGPYLKKLPVDPWENNYFFDCDYDIDKPNNEWRAVIGSYGPNGQGLNDYDEDDIYLIIAPYFEMKD